MALFALVWRLEALRKATKLCVRELWGSPSNSKPKVHMKAAANMTHSHDTLAREFKAGVLVELHFQSTRSFYYY